MNLKELEYIIALNEEQNFTRAAEKLYITPSALTQRITKLEEEIGIPLFIRSRKGVEPTEAGKIYIQATRKMLQLKKDTYKELHDLASLNIGTLSIGIPPERGSAIFSDIYPKFHEKYPSISIILKETGVYNQQKMIEEGNLDIGFMTLSSEQQSDDEYMLIRREEILVAIPETFPVEHYLRNDFYTRYPVISLSDLRYEPFALMSKSSTLRELQELIFRRNHMEPQILFETSRQNSFLDMVACKMCCALVSENYVYSPHAKNVRFVSLKEHPTWNIMACYRKGSYLSEAEEYLIRLFAESLNRDEDQKERMGI